MTKEITEQGSYYVEASVTFLYSETVYADSEEDAVWLAEENAREAPWGDANLLDGTDSPVEIHVVRCEEAPKYTEDTAEEVKDEKPSMV